MEWKRNVIKAGSSLLMKEMPWRNRFFISFSNAGLFSSVFAGLYG
jgi:hypothetical protein